MYDPRYEGLSASDMHTYGAEDMDELVSILDAIDRANGVEVSDASNEPGRLWGPILRAPRRSIGGLDASKVPSRPGVCAVFEEFRPEYNLE